MASVMVECVVMARGHDCSAYLYGIASVKRRS